MHIADDHQFFRKCDWVSEMIDVLDHREASKGKRDITSVLYRGLSLARVLKQNNETFDVDVTASGHPYYVAKHKHYDDYHLMSRKMFDRIGMYFEIEKETDQDIISRWKNGEYSRDHYTDYLARTKKLNLRKAFMKFPCAVDFPNYSHHSLNKPRDGLIVPVIENNKFIDRFSHLDRQVSSDEIFSFSGEL
jgi:hypothetical protein